MTASERKQHIELMAQLALAREILIYCHPVRAYFCSEAHVRLMLAGKGRQDEKLEAAERKIAFSKLFVKRKESINAGIAIDKTLHRRSTLRKPELMKL